MTQKTISIDQALALAKSHAANGELGKARQLYSMVLASSPQNNKAKRGLKALQKKAAKHPPPGLTQSQISHLNMLYSSGRLNEALSEARLLAQTYPNVSFLHNFLGAIYVGLDQPEAAATSYKRALLINPDIAETHYNLGVTLMNLDQADAAIKCYRQALEIRPDYAEAHNNLGNALKELNQLHAAVASYKRALKIRPDHADTHNNLGNALRDLDQLDAAVASFKRALEIKPAHADTHNNLGSALCELGQLDAAMTSFEMALEIKPDFAKVYNNLSTVKKYKPGDAQIELMVNLLSNPESDESDRMHLCFALAKAYEDLGEYNKSFDYLNEANRLRKKELNYDIANDVKRFSKIKALFSGGNVPCSAALSDKDSAIKPIFILGMPRSGTSLVEQILASHTKVYGAGELETMYRLVISIFSKFPDQATGQQSGQISRNDIKTIRDGYLEALTALNVSEKIITDKLPLNFMWIGFILSAFPEAKIISLNRDPRATCWSIYKHYFSDTGNGYAYDMGDLAEFYKLYIDLMSFWRDRFPNKIYDVCYEDLTENQEEETRKLLEFCDLNWEDGCLNFHKTKRTVKTASTAQVRQGLYKGSSEAWKKYETNLQPLIKSLGY